MNRLFSEKTPPKPWQPDFVDAPSLPSLGQIRPAFIVKIGALSFLLLSFTFFILISMDRYRTQASIDRLTEIQKRAQADQAGYRAQDLEFRKTIALPQAIARFLSDHIDPLEYLAPLLSVDPAEFGFKNIEIKPQYITSNPEADEKKKQDKTIQKKEYIVQAEGYSTGSYDNALNQLEQFLDVSARKEPFASQLLDKKVDSLRRDPKLEQFTYTVTLLVGREIGKPAAKKQL